MEMLHCLRGTRRHTALCSLSPSLPTALTPSISPTTTSSANRYDRQEDDPLRPRALRLPGTSTAQQKPKASSKHSTVSKSKQARQPLAPLTPFSVVSSSTQVVVEFLPFAGVSVFALADDRYRLGMAQIYEVVKNHTDPITG